MVRLDFILSFYNITRQLEANNEFEMIILKKEKEE